MMQSHCLCDEFVVPSPVINTIVIHYLIVQMATDDAIEMHMFLGNRRSELTTVGAVPYQLYNGVEVSTFRHQRVVRKLWVIFDA